MRRNLENQGTDMDYINSHISEYKHNTIPVCGYYDDLNKLAIVSIIVMSGSVIRHHNTDPVIRPS